MSIIVSVVLVTLLQYIVSTQYSVSLILQRSDEMFGSRSRGLLQLLQQLGVCGGMSTAFCTKLWEWVWVPSRNHWIQLLPEWVHSCLLYFCVCMWLSVFNSGVMCDPAGLEPIENGMVNYTNTTYNSVATYSCNTGYILSGDDSRRCQENETWSGSIPTCVGI